MQQAARFGAWDWSNTWVLYEGHTAPLLQRYMTPLTLTADSDAKTYDRQAYAFGGGSQYSYAPDPSKIQGSVGYTLLDALDPTQATPNPVNAGTYLIRASGLYSDQHGYLIRFVDGTLAISQANLYYRAALLSRTAGQAPAGMSGSVGDFVSGDTLANATTGTLVWSTPATAASPAGSYAISGSGLSASNYLLQQAPGNATALTLLPAAHQSAPAQEVPAPGARQAGALASLEFCQPDLAGQLPPLRVLCRHPGGPAPAQRSGEAGNPARRGAGAGATAPAGAVPDSPGPS
jgi:hypothetical protein